MLGNRNKPFNSWEGRASNLLKKILDSRSETDYMSALCGFPAKFSRDKEIYNEEFDPGSG